MGKQEKVRCDVFAKVVGYCRRINNWNEGKKQELKDREFATVKSQ